MEAFNFNTIRTNRFRKKSTNTSRSKQLIPISILAIFFFLLFFFNNTSISFPTSLKTSPCLKLQTLKSHKFLWYSPHSGFSNQLSEFKNAVLMAAILNRTLIIPPVLDHHAVVLGSCPKFRVSDPKDLRFAVWNHAIDLIQSHRYVSMADVIDLSSLVSDSGVQVIDFRYFVSLFCDIDVNFFCVKDSKMEDSLLEKLKQCGSLLMGVNMYPSSSLLGDHKDHLVAALPVDELIEKADGFAGVFPEHKYEIVKILQSKKHICGMTGDGVNDAPALKIADIGIAVDDATDAARGASDIVLTEPGLSVIISAVLTSRAIFQRMKNYTIYAVSITIRIVLGFMLLTAFYKFNFPPILVLVIAILNDGTIMTISKDRVKPSPSPDSWKLSEIFATGIVIGTYLAIMTVLFFHLASRTSFFHDKFGVKNLNEHDNKFKSDDAWKACLASAVYLQVSTISQALIFVTRSRGWSFRERPGLLLLTAFILAQLFASVMSAHLTWKFAKIGAIGWGWTGVIWLYNILCYMLLDPIKFAVRYALSGRAWGHVIDRKTAFSTQKDFGREAREAAWAKEQRTLHGLDTSEAKTFAENYTFRDINMMAEEAKRRAEIARLRELHTLKGKVESFAKLRGLDIDVNPHYTV